MDKQKIWTYKPSNRVMQYILAQELGVSKTLAQMLVNRGIFTVVEAQNFLSGTIKDLHDPFLLRDVKPAVERTMAALKAGERILIYGDYDVDGFTATALVLKALNAIGACADYYIPDRVTEGYSLNLDALSRFRKQGVDLLITVDCGVASLEEAAWARENGLDLIITDHHEPGKELPTACAVVNPKREDCPYPFKELAGVGVALKFVQALFSVAGREESEWQDYLDLVCLGTIADIVPLRDENRLLVKYGLRHLSTTTRPGLRALMTVSRLDRDSITPRDIGFILAPRLNAVGRIGNPRHGVELLLCDNTERAQDIAETLQKENAERQKLERKVYAEALKIIEANPDLLDGKVLVLGSTNWHPGVIGIVASKLCNYYYRPVLLVAIEGQEGSGSARSIPGFNMYQALEQCRDVLLGYGGHAMAAGFSVRVEKIDDLRDSINRYAVEIFEEGLMIPSVELDCLISLEDVSETLIKEMKLLSPYGQSNPVPLLGCKGASVLACREVGKTGAHLKMLLQGEKAVVEGIGFNLSRESSPDLVSKGRSVDLAFTPEINEWNGRRSIQLEVKDLQCAGSPLFETDREDDENNNKFAREISPEILRRAGYMLFAPEFIVAELQQHCSDNGADHAVAAFRGTGFGGKVIDLRNSPVDFSWLFNCKKNILLVSTPYQAIECTYYMRRLFQVGSREVSFYHHLINGSHRQTVLSGFEEGKIKTLISTYASVDQIKFSGSANLVAVRLPFSPTELNSLINISNKGVPFDFYLMYDDMDISFNRQKVAALAPGRKWLGAFYLLLKKHVDKRNRKFSFKTQSMIGALRKMKFPDVEAYTIKVALKILSELDLLNYYKIQEGWHVQLGRKPSERLNLNDAGTFRWAQELQLELLSQQGKLLRAPAEELLKSL